MRSGSSRLRRVLAAVGIAAAVLVGVAGPSAADPVSATAINRHVVGWIDMTIQDYDTPDPDDWCYFTMNLDLVLSDQTGPVTPPRMVGKCDNEVRGELDHHYEVLSSGVIRVFGQLRLFEGTTGDTGDKDGEVNYSFIASLGHRQAYADVGNTDENEDDHVWIEWDLTSFVA